jgi:hypothetical protein
MTDDRDPVIQHLFDVADQSFDDAAFVANVMSRVNRQRRRIMIGWLCAGVILLPGVWLLGMLLQDVLQVLMQILPAQLVETEAQWVQRALAPANTIGALIAFSFIGLWMAYRRIFS